MLTGGLADRVTDRPITANVLNPGYVLTDRTMNRGAPKLLVVLTSFKVQSALDGAHTAIWLAAAPELAGTTGEF
jgi:NAD(P)-dependent dehydrogenase (short-subunit alcohol dehydrogenase family)